MPILDLQKQFRQLGRIRIGNQVAGAGGRRHPAKLETFRLTSPSRSLIEAGAAAFGGEVRPWVNPGGGPEFEVVTGVSSLDIVVPPGEVVSQWYELWSGGGCLRRCDSVTNVINATPCGSEPTVAGDRVIAPCPRDPADRIEKAKQGLACKTTTRLTLLLPALPDLGAWMLESHGYYAAVELAGAAEILAVAMARGRLIPARLTLQQRQKRIPGKPTNKYAVPIIEFVDTRMADLQLTESHHAPQLAAGRRPELPPPPALPPTSSFRAPTPSEGPGAADPGTQLPVSTDTPAAAAGPAGGAEAQPDGLTREELLAVLGELHISAGMAHAKAIEVFPDWDGIAELSPAMRAQLATALRIERQEAKVL